MKKDKTMLVQIIEYCTKNGITSYELAKHLPLSQVALHGILSGTTTQPRIKNVKMIYDFLFKDKIQEVDQSTDYGFDKKISEIKAEIEELNSESKRLKQEDPEGNKKTLEHIKKIIDLNYERIELILTAKIEKMKDNYDHGNN